MRHTQRFMLWTVALWTVSILLPFTASTNVAAEVQRFDIELGGDYTYLPSPLGPGIPGCSPSELECGFGIQGSFSIEYDAGTARLLNVDLILLGNEEIQNNPPIIAPVTADRVAQWLEDRRFVAIPSMPVFAAYADETHPELTLTFAGQILLEGGYNATFVDGDGMQFDFTARVIPEPGSAALVGGVLCLMLAAGGRGVAAARMPHFAAKRSGLLKFRHSPVACFHDGVVLLTVGREPRLVRAVNLGNLECH